MRMPPTEAPRGRALGVALACGAGAAAAGLTLLLWRRRERAAAAAAGARAPATDFASFLRDQDAKGRPDGGESDGANEGIANEAANGHDVSFSAPPPPGAAVVTILCGTEYGFAREVAAAVAASLRGARCASGAPLWPRLLDAAAAPRGVDLSAERALIAAISTHGDGVPPSTARAFCDWLDAGVAAAAAPANLAGAPYCVVGLGDATYGPSFCAAARRLDAALAAAGGTRLLPRVDVDGEDWGVVQGAVEEIVTALCRLPLAPGGGGAVIAADAAGPTSPWTAATPAPGRVVAVDQLCAPNDEGKDVVLLTLDVPSSFTYACGDAAGMFAPNPPAAVADLLECAGLNDQQRLPVPSWHWQGQGSLGPPGSPAPLAALLRHCYDLAAPRVDALLTLLRDACAAAEQADEAAAAAAGAAAAAAPAAAIAAVLADRTPSPLKTRGHTDRVLTAADADALLADGPAARAFFQARSVADAVAEFGAPHLPAPALLACLRPLAPRLYSISSAPMSGDSTRLTLTIAAVRYTRAGRRREGVASTHACSRLQPGDALPVYCAPNPDFRLPDDYSTPIILIGPGTGIAPFIAFLQTRAAAAARGTPLGPALVFAGCRRRNLDFLHGPFLEAEAAAGRATLVPAFSRAGPAKVYVQDRVREHGAAVAALLVDKNAKVFICGDASSMAPAVAAALADVVAEHAPNAAAAAGGAEAWLEAARAAGRVVKDCW